MHVVFDNLDGTDLQYTIRPVYEVEGEFDDSTWDTYRKTINRQFTELSTLFFLFNHNHGCCKLIFICTVFVHGSDLWLLPDNLFSTVTRMT